MHRLARTLLYTPKLRHVVLKGICVKLVDSSLETLSIDFEGYPVSLSYGMLYEALSTVQYTLRELSLRQACGFYGPGRGTVAFSVLSIITVEGTISEVLCFFARVRLPPAAKRVIHVIDFQRTSVGMGDLFISPCE